MASITVRLINPRLFLEKNALLRKLIFASHFIHHSSVFLTVLLPTKVKSKETAAAASKNPVAT